MGYYLSKSNKDWLETYIIPLIKDKNETIIISTIQPERAESIIRSASNREEYKWIKEKFILKIRMNKLVFIPRSLEVEVEHSFKGVEQSVNDFFDIINSLLVSPPIIKFTGYYPSPVEIDRLTVWANSNGYLFSTRDGGLIFERLSNESKSNSGTPT